MEVGDFVLTDLLRYSDSWPQVGKIKEMGDTDDNVNILWFNGSLNGSWKPHMLRKKGIRGLVEWTETISKKVIWRYGFELTPKYFLPKHIRDELEKYDSDS